MSYKTSSKIQWVALLGLGLGFSLIYLDASALNLALPFIEREFSTSTAILFWVVNAYVIAIASTALAGGRLADILGLRRTFLLGMVLFGLASAACALSPSSYFLIGARVFQGVGGAVTLATSATIIYHIFPERSRGKAMGIFGLSAVLSVALGPVLGGFFTQYVSWRWIFWINPMIGVVSFVFIYFLLKGLDKDRDHEASFDYLGQLLLMGVLIPMLVSLMQGLSWGWTAPIVLLLFSASLIFLILFLVLEKKRAHPLIDLSLFKNPHFTIANLIFFFTQFALVANVLYALYLQNSLELSPSLAGLALLPSALFSFIANPLAGHLVDKFGFKRVLQTGLLTAVFSFLWLSLTASFLNYIFILIALIILSFSMPLSFISCFMMLMKAAPPSKKGMVSGISVCIRQTGASFCVALMGAIVSSLHQNYHTKLSNQILYVKAFSLTMFIIAIVILLAFISTFWIHTKQKNLSFDNEL